MDAPPPPSPRPGAAGRSGSVALLALAVAGGLLTVSAVVAVVLAVLVGGPGASGNDLAEARTPPTAAAPAHHGGDAQAARAGYAVWATDEAGAPLRWDPCTPIELALAPDGAPASLALEAWRDDVERAVSAIADASGLPLEIVGETDERPSATRPTLTADGQRWAPVLIGWATPDEDELPLRDVDRAIAVPVAVRDGDRHAFVTGQIVLNGERDDLRVGADERADTWGAVLLHELGHLVGLDHVVDPGQIMHHTPGEGPVELGDGDRAGLAALGTGAGCQDPPAPADLDVRFPDR